jgi:hypothetical protein
LSETQVYEPEIRALLGIASYFIEVGVLQLGTALTVRKECRGAHDSQKSAYVSISSPKHRANRYTTFFFFLLYYFRA